MSEISEGMVEETLKLIDRMFYNEEKINYYTVAAKAKVSRPFLYAHPEIVEKILYYKNFNSLSFQERFLKLNSENELLRNHLNKYDEFLLKHYIHSQKED